LLELLIIVCVYGCDIYILVWIRLLLFFIYWNIMMDTDTYMYIEIIKLKDTV